MTRFFHIGLIVLFMVMICLFESVNAQFVSIQIDIEPEISAEVQQNLSFDNIVQNSGITNIGLGDANMGIFTVTGLFDVPLRIDFIFPEFLEQVSDNAQIPLNLNAAYNNKGENEYESATLINNSSIDIIMGQEAEAGRGVNSWHTLYIYIFGQIDAGNIPVGVYSNDIIMVINHM